MTDEKLPKRRIAIKIIIDVDPNIPDERLARMCMSGIDAINSPLTELKIIKAKIGGQEFGNDA